jgi:hypothetical protein
MGILGRASDCCLSLCPCLIFFMCDEAELLINGLAYILT